MWVKKIKQDFKERFLRFESFNGAFIFIPWGAGFIYYGVYDQARGYQYAMVTVGLVLVIWGLRKTFVNRIKQAAKTEALVQERIAIEATPETPAVDIGES